MCTATAFDVAEVHPFVPSLLFSIEPSVLHVLIVRAVTSVNLHILSSVRRLASYWLVLPGQYILEQGLQSEIRGLIDQTAL